VWRDLLQKFGSLDQTALTTSQFGQADEGSPTMAGRLAASSMPARSRSCSASDQEPRQRQMPAYWVRQTANSGRKPHLAQHAFSRVHHWTARSKSRTRSHAAIM